MGRSEKYNDDFPLLAEDYARQGMKDIDIARKLGISKQTFYNYQKIYIDFLDSIKKGKAPMPTMNFSSLKDLSTLGGLQMLAKNQPWIFDFTKKTPRSGYNKQLP